MFFGYICVEICYVDKKFKVVRSKKFCMFLIFIVEVMFCVINDINVGVVYIFCNYIFLVLLDIFICVIDERFVV